MSGLKASILRAVGGASTAILTALYRWGCWWGELKLWFGPGLEEVGSDGSTGEVVTGRGLKGVEEWKLRFLGSTDFKKLNGRQSGLTTRKDYRARILVYSRAELMNHL